MTGIWDIHHHVLCKSVPRSVGLVGVCSAPFPFLIQAPRKTNDLEGIYEHIPQLSVNRIHIFLYFLFLTTQCRCTLTWRWSCLWSAQVHAESLSWDWIFSRRPTLWFLGILSTWTPSAHHLFDSNPWSDGFSESHSILLFQVAIGSSPIFPTQSTGSEKT